METIRSTALLFVLMTSTGVAGCSAGPPTAIAGGAPPDGQGGSTSGGSGQTPSPSSSGGGLNLGGSSGTAGAGGEGSSSGGGCAAPPLNACSGSDAECNDGNPCTDDVCKAEGEFFKCQYTPIANCQGDPTAPIDSSCDQAQGPQDSITVPYVPLVTPNLPASCNMGFEWQNCNSTYVVPATESGCGTTDNRTLYVDIATYTLGDRLKITAIGDDGQESVLLDTCRIRTWDHPDPTNGMTRPPDETIRQFQIVVKAGTKSLEFDATNAFTPWYMRVLGLCAFEPLPASSTCAWRTASLP